MEGNTAIVLIKLVLVVGGLVGFCWWQLRSVARDQAATRRERPGAGDPPHDGRDDGPEKG